MNLVLLFILVSCGSLGAVVASDDGNLVIGELTEKIERLEAQNQEKDAIIQELTKEKQTLQVEKDKLDVENKKLMADNGNMEEELLRLEQFKIAGVWSSWGHWSTCNSSCGGGVRERIRMCDNPTASCGGPECVGNEEGESDEIHETQFETSLLTQGYS